MKFSAIYCGSIFPKLCLGEMSDSKIGFELDSNLWKRPDVVPGWDSGVKFDGVSGMNSKLILEWNLMEVSTKDPKTESKHPPTPSLIVVAPSLLMPGCSGGGRWFRRAAPLKARAVQAGLPCEQLPVVQAAGNNPAVHCAPTYAQISGSRAILELLIEASIFLVEGGVFLKTYGCRLEKTQDNVAR
jgi:hypothetical protein